jgi:hypothetical protein
MNRYIVPCFVVVEAENSYDAARIANELRFPQDTDTPVVLTVDEIIPVHEIKIHGDNYPTTLVDTIPGVSFEGEP